MLIRQVAYATNHEEMSLNSNEKGSKGTNFGDARALVKEAL